MTGRYLGDIVDGKRKGGITSSAGTGENVDIAGMIAVGDGANDPPMLLRQDWESPFTPNRRWESNAQQAINTIGPGWRVVFLGFKDFYLDERGKL